MPCIRLMEQYKYGVRAGSKLGVAASKAPLCISTHRQVGNHYWNSDVNCDDVLKVLNAAQEGDIDFSNVQGINSNVAMQ